MRTACGGGFDPDDVGERVVHGQRREDFLGVAHEQVGQTGIQVPAGPAGHLGDGPRGSRRGMGEHGLLRDVDDACRQGQPLASAAFGDAQAVPAFVDLVERGDRGGVEAEPRPQRSAHLAPATRRHRTDGGGELDESLRQRRGRGLTGPPTELGELTAEHRRIAGVERLESGLERHVVDEVGGVLARMGGAPDCPEQGDLKHHSPLTVGQTERPRQGLGRRTGLQPLLEGNARGEVRGQGQRGEDLDDPHPSPIPADHAPILAILSCDGFDV